MALLKGPSPGTVKCKAFCKSLLSHCKGSSVTSYANENLTRITPPRLLSVSRY